VPLPIPRHDAIPEIEIWICGPTLKRHRRSRWRFLYVDLAFLYVDKEEHF
jgi:hypothetical protein